MTDRPITLDRHRGMAAQKATEVRRLLAEVAADQEALRERQGDSKPGSLRRRLPHGPRLPKRRYLLQLLRPPRSRRIRAGKPWSRACSKLHPPQRGRCSRREQIGVGNQLATLDLEGDLAVANREQRGNREKRKPKAEKPKGPAQVSPFARTQGTSSPKSNAGKKGR
jgi:hypothetical protein